MIRIEKDRLKKVEVEIEEVENKIRHIILI